MSRCAEKESVWLACTRGQVDSTSTRIGQEKQSHNSHNWHVAREKNILGQKYATAFHISLSVDKII